MDQALSFTTGTLTGKQVETLLGFLPEEFLVGFASALLEHQAEGVLQWVKQLMEEGWELQQFVKDFREFLRESIVDEIAGGKKPDALADCRTDRFLGACAAHRESARPVRGRHALER